MRFSKPLIILIALTIILAVFAASQLLPSPSKPTATGPKWMAIQSRRAASTGGGGRGVVCLVYLTFIGCPNCAVTDPVVMVEWPKRYEGLVVIEFGWLGGDVNSPNSRAAMRYVGAYHSHAAVPQIILNGSRVWVGRLRVLDAEKELGGLASNPCPIVLDSEPASKPFEELDPNSLPGLPKIWANGRVLISLGNGSWILAWNGSGVSEEVSGGEVMDGARLKQLLFAEDLESLLKGYRFEVLGRVAVPFSGSAFPPSEGYVQRAYFENAVKIPLK